MTLLNTHAIVKKFIQHGFSEQQAEVVVDAINDQNDQLATKSDLYNLELRIDSKIESINTRIESINASINWLKVISIANLTIVAGSVFGGIVAVLLQKMF